MRSVKAIGGSVLAGCLGLAVLWVGVAGCGPTQETDVPVAYSVVRHPIYTTGPPRQSSARFESMGEAQNTCFPFDLGPIVGYISEQ